MHVVEITSLWLTLECAAQLQCLDRKRIGVLIDITHAKQQYFRQESFEHSGICFAIMARLRMSGSLSLSFLNRFSMLG